MAGDWIKMRVDLQTHPKIVRILSETGTDKFSVIGGLHAVWSVFDAHSVDGLLIGYSLATMDHVIGWSGFSEAMESVGWLEEASQGLVMPEFETHNGKSAKRRGEDQKRKRVSRSSDNSPQNVRKASDKKRTREEKSREEDRGTPYSPPSGDALDDAFEMFWSAGMRKVGKKAARKAFAAAIKRDKATPDDFAARLYDDVNRRLQAQQLGFDAMHPTTYLNGERWNDEIQHGTPAGRRLSPAEEVERALEERDRAAGGGLGVAQDGRDVRGAVDPGARHGATYDMDAGAWQT